ncbi:MltR family transcriptional regulator [Zophobihabitans entericus]|uniref:MltR family transcriptional regulator n=1 Tax=Zophobihabitans entericus TaxID=1635327 RepID=A0A6G9IBQ6_9GAMM|nr:MltR family transcriptional regulator [Zophobihabitans entericus]QIQ21661.1 MltR family transcriptional regulator [Zophobihabitans entericus]
MSDTQHEDYILEQLNQKPDIHGLLITAIDLIGKSVNKLIMKVFRKERHAIKFVIPSLIGHKGPLNDLSVRLKLLYALGIISREEYEDIELLMAILDELENDETLYTYTDDEILGPISLLHDMVLPPNLPITRTATSEVGIVDSMKSSMYSHRYEQMIRSALIIAITDLTLRISEKQKHNYFP